MKVVIVDDQAGFRKMLTAMLEDIDCVEEVKEVDDGEGFLEVIRNEIPDVVFMDIEMPGLNGIEATRKAVEMFRNIYIIAISVHDSFDVIKETIEAGARNYLTKDKVSEKTLRNILSNI